MTWNHRLVRRTYPDAAQGVWFGIHEAYYDDDGKIYAITEEPVAPCGEAVEELREEISRMARALSAPVVIYEDVVRGC